MQQTTNRTGIVFAGTSEGSRLFGFCMDMQINAVFCVATEYGKEMLCKHEAVRTSSCCSIRVGRMKQEDMEDFMRKVQPVFVIDATHPYAKEATENIRNAAENYRQECHIEGKVYYRVLRKLDVGEESEMPEKISYHSDMERAAVYLQSTEGNVLATTGSKQIDVLCKLKDYQERVWLRILPNVEMLQKCLQAGFLPSHIICMQGPFSREMNELMLRQYDIKYLLTKQSGVQGGYPEKVRAAKACGAELVVLAPPQESGGVSVEEMCEILLRIGM